MVSETLAEVMRDQSADLTERALVKAQAAGVEPTKAVIADFIREDLQTTINVSHLGGSVAALLMGLDPTVAGYTAANALYNNFALSTVRKAIEEYGEALAAGAHESYESVKSALEGATSEALERIADILENHPERVAMCAEIMILSIVAAREERLGRPASHAAGIGKGPTGQKIEAQKKEGITATLKAAPKFFKDLARSIRSGRSGGGAGAGGASSVAVSAAGAVRPAEPARQPQKQVRFADGPDGMGSSTREQLFGTDKIFQGGGERVRPIGGRRPLNYEYAGKIYPLEKLPRDLQIKYPHSVPFTGSGHADFSRYAVKKVTIPFSGDSSKDIRLANKLCGYKETPDNFTWHHSHDGKTMMLVDEKLHDAVRHTGGDAIARSKGTTK